MEATQDSSLNAFLDKLALLNKSSFPDGTLRLKALKTVRALLQRLEEPAEKATSIVWATPILIATLKIGADLGLYRHMDDVKFRSSNELSSRVNCDPVLLRRILRVLANGGVVEQQEDNDQWLGTEWSRSLIDPAGLVSGIGNLWDVGILQMQHLPFHLARTGYVNPSDCAHPPQEDWLGEASFWKWCETHPEAHTRFNNFLSILRQGQQGWLEVYPLEERILTDYDAARAPLAIDIGGGKGDDMKQLVDALPNELKDVSRIVLQDLSAVLRETEDLPLSIHPMEHDFFKSQPEECCGAKLYLLHFILHDWPDNKCRDILRKVKEAMTPGYSKLLLRELIVPARATESGLLASAMDLVMMGHFAAMERTENQWRALLSSVGMKVNHVARVGASPYAILEVDIA